MIELWNKLLHFWFSFSRVLRFILVGGFNTIFSFCVFSLLIYLKTSYPIALTIAYILGVNCSILTMCYFVYQSQNTILKSYTKGWITYLSLFLLNYISLYFLVDICHLSPIPAQAVYTVCSIVYIYLMHKYFTFNDNHK
ncbi:MAG: GtrA family protein [Alphaproteobacteria bacterium]|nr:GtrA family protein [Alphaproteobacteria bacterium]